MMKMENWVYVMVCSTCLVLDIYVKVDRIVTSELEKSDVTS